VLCSSLIIVNLDTTVLNVALPTLVRDLHATSSQLQWVVDAYALVFGGLVLVAGSLADRFGRKRTFVLGLVAFAAGSGWAAFSGSVGLLVAARASMGVGAALMMPSTLSIITDVFRDPQQRQKAIGVWAGASGLGFALGPIVGGLLLAHFWWGSVFLINLPIALAAALLAIPLVPDSKNPAALRPDVAGALLGVAGVGLVLWAVIEAPVDGWTSAMVIGPGASGVVLLGAFAAWERASSHPMLNLEFFRSRSFSVAVSSVGLVMFGLIGSLFMLTQFLQFDLGYTALQSGERMLPIAAVLALVAPSSAALNRAVGTKVTTATGMFLAALGLWMMSRATVGWSYGDLLPDMMVVGFGVALVMPSVSASVMSSVPSSDTGVGSATNGTFIQLGGAVGVAVIGSLLSTRYQGRIAQAVAHYRMTPSAAHSVLGSIGGALAVAARVGGVAGSSLAHEARLAFISGTDLGLFPAAVVVLAGFALALAALPARAHLAAHLAGRSTQVDDRNAPAGLEEANGGELPSDAVTARHARRAQ
jgi:EmrB/QacA subfamily drug resistance transporter